MNLSTGSTEPNCRSHAHRTARTLGLLVLPLALAAGSLGITGCQTTETHDPGGLHQHESPQRPADQQPAPAPQQQEQQQQQQW